MAKMRSTVVALVTALMLGAISIGAVAQDDAASPEGTGWDLTGYLVDGSLAAVPADVRATLLLQDGEATGSGGCNTFFGSYSIDGSSIAFGDAFGQTQIFCGGDAQAVEDAYLALLPTAATWAVEAETLTLSGADGEALLVFAAGEAGTATDMDRVLALLEAVQAQLGAMDARIVALESGSGGSGSDNSGGDTTSKLKKPAAPKSKGKVQTTFPDWMRDEFRPEAERSANKNREVINWRLKSKDVEGQRVYARRGYCALKKSADPTQELVESDFTLKTTKPILLEELPAGARRYRPDHETIESAIPTVAVSPYSNDQYYDVLVSAFNEKGESKKKRVASYFLTPEFRCP